MNVNFTADDVVAQVRALAAESPDYIYPGANTAAGCSYVDDVFGSREGKGCLIGQALQRLGVDREWLRTHADTSSEISEGFSGGVRYVLKQLLKIPEESTYQNSYIFLELVQSDQDNGNSWADAVASADSDLEIQTLGQA